MHVQGFLFDELAEPVGFVPHVVASAPHAIVCMPDHGIEAKIAKAKAVLRWLLQRHRTAFSTSFGKDSSTVLGLAMSVAADLASEGLPVRDFCVLTSDTGVENPLISALADMEIEKVRAWIKQHDLPGSVHVARPSLADQFPVMIIGGRCLPSMAGHKRDCTVSWKTTPLTRLRKRLLGRNQVAAGNYAVSVTGVRTDESATRARNLAQRAESDVALVQTNEEGNVALAPILGWSYDDVWEYLGLCRSGLEHTYSRFDRVIELYREAMGECVLGGSDSARTARPCSARTGCYVCLAVKEDKSMDQMVQESHNQFMRPLAAFRTFLANTFHDLSRRTWVGRTIDAHGYIRFAPDGYISYGVNHLTTSTAQLTSYAL